MIAVVVAALLAVQQPPPPPPDTTKRDTTKIKLDSLPLRTTREVSFETTEGTWISLDVSPDGHTIVFELLGDLYTMPIAGGTATRLTSGPAFDSQPRYSPDGKQIVFLSDRNGSENVWICDADGRNTKAVTKGDRNLYASPEWTPDGQYIVVSKTQMPLGSSYELWLIHKDGGSGVSITKDDRGFAPGQPGRTGTNALGAAFGSDARYIWYARHRGGFGYNLTFPEWEIAIQDRQTGRVYNQTDLYGGAMRPVLSPDGKWLVYVTRYDAETGIRLRNLQTGDERWLVYPVQRDDQESRFTRDLYPGSSFTPDSKALIVSYGGKIWRVEVPSGTATAIPFTAHVQQSLGPLVRTSVRVDTGDVLIHQIRNATPSPDGRRLAFSAFDRLYVMDLPNGTPRRVTTDSVQEQVPAWSPDGQWLAYVTWTEQGGALDKVRSTGGKPVRLSVDTSYYDAPVWSPDGRRIVVVKGPRRPKLENHQGPGYEIAWLPATGGPTTRISPTSFAGRPHFTRNPDRVYVYEGNEGLVSMRWDGTDRRVHVRITGYTVPLPQAEPFAAAEVQISPDSSQVIAQASNYVYLVALPLVGGTPVAINVSDPSSAAFPVKKLARVGGDFIGWSTDAKSVYWSIGRTFFRHDIAAADSAEKPKARVDSLRADSLKGDAFKALPDSVQKRLRSRNDSLTKLPAYEPLRVDVSIRGPRDVPRGTVVLRGARIISMKGDEVVENGDLVVTNNRIVSVGPRGDVPAGARVIDVSGKTIIPGFVDIHAHPWPEWGIHENQEWPFLANLAWGVTTVRDPQTATTDILTYDDLMETGEIIGPRLYYTGPGVFGAYLEENFTSLDDVRQTLRRYSEFYRVHTIKQYMVGNRKQRQWVIMAAKELGLMPTIEGGLDFKMNLTVAADGYPGSEHSYPITPLYNDDIQFIAQSGITYTPTLLVNYGGPWAENYFYEHNDIHDMPKVQRFFPHEEIDQRAERRQWFRDNQYVFPRIAASAAAILRAGGYVGLGGHGQMDGLGDHWELWGMAAGGMKPLEVLRVATWNGAHAIGLEQDLGSLEPGKLADLIVLDANPLEDIHNTNTIKYVMKNGRLYEGDTLNEIYPRQRALPRLWWWGNEPAKAAETLR
ncbi:MAG TPA: amidohydrolase family protein [Gemmatimonadales bacterium]|nr:amidohydrolase family protein [Gemmatimonadales bacterium]